jgi:hypothetical protein
MRSSPSTRRIRTLALAALACLAAPAAALAQGWDESIPREVDAEILGTDPALMNQRLKFNAKIIAIAGDELIIRKNERVPLWLDEKENAVAIVMPTLHEGDNIRVFGYLTTRRGRSGQFFLVKNVLKRPDDITLYKQEITKLEAAGDMQGLFKLGQEIEADGKALRKETVYLPVAKEAYRAGVALKEKTLKPDDPAGWVALAGDYLKNLGDRAGALERLVRAIKPGEIPSDPTVVKMLGELDAVLYGGQYVLFEEMKRREGFVDRGGKWVLKERAEFDDAVEQQRQSRTKARKLLDEYYAEIARAGNVELGMRKAEVATAIGFPSDVDRQRRSSDVYDAWTYEGRGTFYFENNELFRRPDMPR